MQCFTHIWISLYNDVMIFKWGKEKKQSKIGGKSKRFSALSKF